MSIAQDAQGEGFVTPWLEKANTTFPTLLDRHNQIGKAYGVKYVPVGVLIDADGLLVRPVSMVDIRDPAFQLELEEWVTRGILPPSWKDGSSRGSTSLSPSEQQSDEHLQNAVKHLDNDDREAALEELQEAVTLDPENWLIRKQRWAIEKPEAFYKGEVDYEWQKSRIESENKQDRSDSG